MKGSQIHPWQSGPAELLKFALEHSSELDDINQRVSFVLFDIGLETLFKTYLTLPAEITKTNAPYSERKNYASSHFHDLLKGIRLTASNKVNEKDLQHVEFYHNIRNNLYHQGNGITVRRDHVIGYATIATTLLKQLLDVDLTDFAEAEGLLSAENATAVATAEKLRKDFAKTINQLRDSVNLFIEKVEPRLIYPSTIGKLKEIASGIDVATFPLKVDDLRTLIEEKLNNSEMKTWLLNLVAYDIYGDGPQVTLNTKFLMELGEDPIAFYLFLIGFFYLPVGDVRKESIDKTEDISFIESDDYHILGIYSVGCGLLKYSLAEPYSRRLNDDMIRRCEEVLTKVKTMAIKINTLIQS
jgi:hypothetical protein